MDHLTPGPGPAGLPQALLRPESYPPPRPGRVELRTTHISWVFLAGEQVWKLKRPVDLGFLDFRQLEQRQHFCAEELRLNRRLAPGVYLEVVPVRRTADGYTVDPGRQDAGPVVDWAVKMRRLPDQASAAALLAAGRLGPAHLAALAARLARFYEAAPAASLAQGSPEVLAANVEENFAQLAPFAGQVLPGAALAAAAADQRRDLRRHAGLLAARQAEGKIRDGHGDLRLEHVYFVDEAGAGDGGGGAPDATQARGVPEPLIIDCLEFSARFRCADVALDVAFLAMELRAAGRAELAEYFVQRFAEESGDHAFYPLLDFYQAYRAVVRAKVACFLAADPGAPAEKRARKAEEARRLLALTLALEEGPRPRPVVIAVGGIVGSGKSTIADALAAGLGLPVVATDRARKALAGIAATERGSPAIYDAAFSERTYAEVVRRAELVLRSGRGVILDGTFRTPAQRRQARELAAAHDAAFLFLEVTCDDATLRARLRARARGPSVSDAGEAELERIRRELVPAEELPSAERLRLDGGRPPEETVAMVRARLTASA